MNFKSDSQRKAVMSKFALYNIGSKSNVVRSDEVPSVAFEVRNVEAVLDKDDFDNFDKALSSVDERHLGDLTYIFALPKGHSSFNKKDVRGYYKVRDEKPAIGFMDPKTSGHKLSDVVIHEVGHHVARGGLGQDYLDKIGNYGQEVLADEYMSNITGSKNRYVHKKDREGAADVLAYAETVQELKNPTIDELSKYADNKFSFWERKNKGWYPADSKLPDEFPAVVRNVAFGVLGKDPTYITPDNDAQLTKLTGDVCSELDKVWKPEWGTRPSGHYLRADVKDAWEDLD